MNDFAKETVYGLILLINAAMYLISLRITKSISLQQVLMHNSMFYGLLSFFILTFLFEDQPYLYYPLNALYFAVTTCLFVWALRKGYHIRYRIFLMFWFAFVVYKYYDLVWSLVHKSVTFLLTGLLILIIVQRFDKRISNFVYTESKRQIKAVSIISVIIIQLIILGIQVGKSETLLANGELIKLQLAPVDPRSLLQGDYLTLRYAISNLPIENDGWNKLVKVGLNKNKNGIYVYSGHYVVGKEIPKDIKEKADVWIVGRFKGNTNVEYGIENYFVPEGTGLELQEKVNYAYVKVATNGDAMLINLSE